jgi:hypothetical protein
MIIGPQVNIVKRGGGARFFNSHGCSRFWHVRTLRSHNRPSKRFSVRSWVRPADSWHSCERKSWVFRCIFQVFSGMQGMLTGWVGIYSPYSWPFHRSCTPWSGTSHKVAWARSALRKPSIRSGWAASFAIPLNSQLRDKDDWHTTTY